MERVNASWVPRRGVWGWGGAKPGGLGVPKVVIWRNRDHIGKRRKRVSLRTIPEIKPDRGGLTKKKKRKEKKKTHDCIEEKSIHWGAGGRLGRIPKGVT